MTADQILELLAVKHSKDVFVSECKTGPTMVGSAQRLDAWVMRKSWAHPCVLGYEIKVTRADFLGDDKWTSYVDYCNEFSFVVAPGVCEPSELPDGIGLLVASKNCMRLMTKRKAAHRDIEIPDDIFRYILMWRTEVTKEWLHETQAEYWARWLKEKGEEQQLGHMVSERLKALYAERVTAVESKNAALLRENTMLARVKPILEKLGVTTYSTWNLEDKIEAAVRAASGGKLAKEITSVVKGLTEVQAALTPAAEDE